MRYFFLIISSLMVLFSNELIIPIKNNIKVDRNKVALGEKLFFDTILSRDNTISCASCHKPTHGWADDVSLSTGVNNQTGKINSPTILNSVYNFKQLWNGSYSTLKEQASSPIHNSYEMNMNESLIEQRLNKNQQYLKEFKKAYNVDAIKYDNVVDAIAEFEKTLVTPNSKFDLYLQGKQKLSKDEQKGYILFKTLGCITCHNGINIGGNSFQKIGIVIKYENCNKDRHETTTKEFDKCVYKVPSLRNIALTAPYFHDGSAKTLNKAIKKMAHHNLGFDIEDDEINYIKAFLNTLTGKLDKYENTNER